MTKPKTEPKRIRNERRVFESGLSQGFEQGKLQAEKDMSDHLEAVYQRTKQAIIELFKEDSIYTGAVIKYEINNMK
jgi:hypothetical protein